VNDLYPLLAQISETLYSIVDKTPNGFGSVRDTGEEPVNDAQQACDGAAGKSELDFELDQLSKSDPTMFVKQLNQQLAEFRDQLKKNRQLFPVQVNLKLSLGSFKVPYQLT